MSRTSQKIIIGIGLFLAFIGFGSEFFSSAAGYGPYQLMLIWLGILIALLGLIPSQSWLSKIVVIVFSISLTLVLLEGMIWGWLKVTPPDDANFYRNNLINDEVLIHRMKPFAQGHDANGWRNPVALDEADIVTIGDSQAWGYNTSDREAWTLITGELLNQTVYNMGFPGYGVADYYSLIPEALSHNPDTVLMMVYFGNDFINTVEMVYNRPAYTEFRAPELDNQGTINDIQQLIQQAESARLPDVGVSPSPFILWLSTTATGKILIYKGIWQLEPSLIERYKALPLDAPEQQDFYTDGDIPHYFTPALREPALNLQIPIIAEGMRLTQVFLSESKQTIHNADAQLAVILMPTAELVYEPLVEAQHGELTSAYQNLVMAETQAREELMTFLDDEGIPYLDLLHPLQEFALDGGNLFPSIDTHPTVEGNRLIAEYIAENWAIIQP